MTSVSSSPPRRRFLLIAPLFPPHGSSGVQRAAKLVRYARPLGWDASVIAMKRPLYRQFPLDESLLDELGSVPVERLPRVELRYLPRALHALGFPELGAQSEWLLPVDGFLGWVPFAIRAAERQMRTWRPELVVTTSAPFSAHLVGLWLKRRYGLPWLADYRDPWTTNDLYDAYRGHTKLSRYKTRVDRSVERRLLARADHSTVVVERHRDDLIEQFGAKPEDVSVIYNGFDEADFAGRAYPIPPARNPFRLTYLGAFHRHHDASGLLPMWRRFLSLDGVDRASAQLRLVGECSDWMRAHEDLWADIADTIELCSYVPHDQVPALMAESTALFIVFSRPWVITGKLFEYLRSGLPVFGVASEKGTVMERMLAEAGTGTVVVDGDVDAGATELRRLYDESRTGAWTHRPNLDAVHAYNRERQTEAFVALFERLASQPGKR